MPTISIRIQLIKVRMYLIDFSANNELIYLLREGMSGKEIRKRMD